MKQKSKIILIGLISAVILIAINMNTEQQKENNTGTANGGLEKRALTIGTAVLQVELAQTTQQRMTGLSHRSELAEDHGMLFIFDTDGRHGIWMKDMQFPIDIIWIDAAMKVVHIAGSVTPETYPKSFTSQTPARYVLEVPAGYADEKITIGDSAVLQDL